jgi:hypothetical protein
MAMVVLRLSLALVLGVSLADANATAPLEHRDVFMAGYGAGQSSCTATAVAAVAPTSSDPCANLTWKDHKIWLRYKLKGRKDVQPKPVIQVAGKLGECFVFKYENILRRAAARYSEEQMAQRAYFHSGFVEIVRVRRWIEAFLKNPKSLIDGFDEADDESYTLESGALSARQNVTVAGASFTGGIGLCMLPPFAVKHLKDSIYSKGVAILAGCGCAAGYVTDFFAASLNDLSSQNYTITECAETKKRPCMPGPSSSQLQMNDRINKQLDQPCAKEDSTCEFNKKVQEALQAAQAVKNFLIFERALKARRARKTSVFNMLVASECTLRMTLKAAHEQYLEYIADSGEPDLEFEL